MTMLGIRPQHWEAPETAHGGVHVDVDVGCDRSIEYHHHNVYELTLIRGMSGQRLIGTHSSPFTDKELVLLAPDLPHGWTVETHNPQNAVSTAVLFDHDSIGNELLTRTDARLVRQLLDGARRGIVFSASCVESCAAAITELRQAQGLRRRLLFLLLLEQLANDHGRQFILSDAHLPRGNVHDYRRLSQVLQMIQDHDGQQIHLETAAAQLQMSVPTFTRFFRRMTGTSFISYCNRWRVDRACVLLRATDDSVLSISQRVGYANLSHFNRQFRRTMGMAPTAYRRQEASWQDSTEQLGQPVS